MKFSHALLISVGFSLASWIPFYALPDTVYELKVQDQSEIIQFEKLDIAPLWLALSLFLNPFPWLMWKVLLGVLDQRDREIKSMYEEQDKDYRLKAWMEFNNPQKGKW